MMVSLDHTIYFHRPREVKADEWMCTEMESPWSGEGRGLVTQRIWNKEGRLVATCVQEVSLMDRLQINFLQYLTIDCFLQGLVRLQQDQPAPETKL